MTPTPTKAAYWRKFATCAIRLLIGALFIATAILKLLSIDEFELYIYSLGIFNYLTVTVLSRLIIAFEFLIGLFLIIKQYYKYVWLLTMLTLLGFTLFLIYAAVFRSDENCHCFGELIELNPLHSILKNAITILLLLFIRKEPDYQFRFRKLVMGICVAVAVIVPFVVVPMDMFYNKFVSPNISINMKAYQELQKNTTDFDVERGNYIVAFSLPKCKSCKRGMKKINTIVEKHNIDINRIKIFICGDDKGIEEFKKELALPDYQFFKISPYQAIYVTYDSSKKESAFPTFLYVQDGNIVKSIDLIGLSEEELVSFLK
jgi:hypothetical protein